MNVDGVRAISDPYDLSIGNSLLGRRKAKIGKALKTRRLGLLAAPLSSMFLKQNSSILFQAKKAEMAFVMEETTMVAKIQMDRVAFSPGEFAQLFGKSQTWGYRQIYAGKVKAITEHGRILIPAAEVDAILKKAGIYDGLKSKTVKTKTEIQGLAPRLGNAWQSFLAVRRQSTQPKNQVKAVSGAKKWPSTPSGRQAAMARLGGRKR